MWYLSFCLSVCLSIHPSIHPSVCLLDFQCSTCYWFSVTFHQICPFIASSVNFFCFITLSTSFSHFTSGCHHHLPPSDHVIVHLGLLWCDTKLMFWRLVPQHSAVFQALCSVMLPWQLAGLFIEMICILLLFTKLCDITGQDTAGLLITVPCLSWLCPVRNRKVNLLPVWNSDGDESWADKQQRVLERARKRALGTSVMQELQEEYFDRPSEVSHRDATKATLVQQLRHKEE